MLAALCIEFHTESFFQGRANDGECRKMPFVCPEFGFARVGRKEPCNVLRVGQRRRVKQNAL